ncbi:MAG: hypothetical protein KAW09_08760, partial [Thermoplasmata archaeon]|nr:hypothetical protein [Thermoplasmata archaeon]
MHPLENTDGPTFPLEVSTDKYVYALREHVSIRLSNVGDKEIVFPMPPDLYVVDSALRVVVDTKFCPKLTVELRILPGTRIQMGWYKNYTICDVNGDYLPPSGDPVPEGRYLVSVGMEDAKYGGAWMPIWDSVWIRIGS